MIGHRSEAFDHLGIEPDKTSHFHYIALLREVTDGGNGVNHDFGPFFMFRSITTKPNELFV